MTIMDLSGNGRSDLLVTSPWGLGVVGWSGQSLSASGLCQNGQRIGEWALDTAVNATPLKADVDGDGIREVLLSSPWGIGVAKFSKGASTTLAMAANGTRVGDWVVDTTNNRFLHAADVDGDGRDEIVVTSPWGLGILALRSGGITTLALAANGTRLGDWLLDTADNWLPVVGDLDGDGHDEIVVTSPWGLGVLRLDGIALTSIAMVPNGSVIGSWTLDTSSDRVEAAADVDGDGHAALVISGPQGVAILGLDGSTLVQRGFVGGGAPAGDWVVDAPHNSFHVGDVDGDGCDEIVVTSDWGLGVLKLSDGTVRSPLMAPNGTRFGGWNLNTRDNRFGPIFDVDGDGSDEMVVTSPWGIGILRLGGVTGSALTVCPNGTRLGDWNLNTADNDWLAGDSHHWAVILHHPDWSGAVAETEQVLRDRGYVVLETDGATTGTKLLSSLARTARGTDRVFVYLAGHGATGRAIGDYSPDEALSHIIQFGAGDVLSLRDIAPSFELMAEKGADVMVFDGSCDAGETVVAAAGKRYLAMSTTGAQAPGKTNSPSPGGVIKQFGQPSHFGMWWSAADATSRLTGAAPHGFYNKIYRSDDTAIARASVFYKTAIQFYSAVAEGWNLVTRSCYLYEYIYADAFSDPNPAAEIVSYKAAKKVSADDYLASLKLDFDGHAPAVATLRSILGDHDLIARAADVYAAAFPVPWQTTTGDLGWNVVFERVKTFDDDAVLSAISWAGAEGFAALVVECIRQLDQLAASWNTQETRLRQLDAKMRHDQIFREITNVSELRAVPTIAQEQRRAKFYEQQRTLRLSLVPPHLVEPATSPKPDGPLGAPRLVFPPADPHRIPHVVAPHDVAPGIPAMPVSAPHTIQADHLAHGLVSIDQISAAIAVPLAERAQTWATDETEAQLIAEIRATEAACGIILDQLHYYLTIVEEAVSRAQETRTQPADLIAF